MRILSIFLMAVVAQISIAGAQTQEMHKKGKAIVEEFNKVGNEYLRKNPSYDLRPTHKVMAQFLIKQMKQHNLALIINNTYMGMDKRDYVTYHLIDSLDLKAPTIAHKLQIYFTGDLDPITTMYYVEKTLFANHKKELKQIEIKHNQQGRYPQVNKQLADILESGQHNSIFVIR